MKTLHYIYDPMCSWCWGFRPTWEAIQAGLGDGFNTRYVLGGLAPDSQEPMPESMQQKLQMTWRRIQEVIPDTTFNYDFWVDCQPRRSTYPACRAVIAATQQGANFEAPMVLAIQQAYYLQAKNPSNEDVLCECAESIGVDVALFSAFLQGEEVHQLLQKDIDYFHYLSAKTGAAGFPSLVLSDNIDSSIAVPIDYNHPQVSLDFIRNQET